MPEARGQEATKAQSQTAELDRFRALAESLGCLTEEDLCILADVTPCTAEAWRKRGKGPAYVLIGKRYLYPRPAFAEYLQTQVRERQPATAGLI